MYRLRVVGCDKRRHPYMKLARQTPGVNNLGLRAAMVLETSTKVKALESSQKALKPYGHFAHPRPPFRPEHVRCAEQDMQSFRPTP